MTHYKGKSLPSPVSGRWWAFLPSPGRGWGWAFFLVCLLLSSCVRRPLEVYFQKKVNVRINVDWMKNYGYRPSSMTLVLYNENDSLYRSLPPTSNVDYQNVSLEPGIYKLIVFNQTYDEFPSIYFRDWQNHNEFSARAKPITTRASRRWDANIQYMCDPDNIGVAVDRFTITQEMTEDDYLTFVDYRQRNNIPDTIHYVFNEVVNPMITQLNVRVMVKGFSSMRSVEANISGMADGFYMSRVDRTQETGILLLDNWKATPIEGEDDKGWVTTSIATFGLPFGKERVANRDSTDNVLQMGFLLQDGTVKTFSYNVGKIMKYLTPSGDALSKAELLKHIVVEIVLDDPLNTPDLPPVDPKDQQASGFEAHVDDWEFGGTIEAKF